MRTVSDSALVLFLIAVLSIPLVSQQAWFVSSQDPAHFRTLKEAIDSPLVLDGDVLVVWIPVPSPSIETSKGLRIVGYRGGAYEMSNLKVHDLPRTSRFILVGASSGADYIHFEDCEGEIMVSQLGVGSGGWAEPYLLFRNCRRASVNQGSIPECTVIDSTVSFSRLGISQITTAAARPALTLRNSDVTMSNCGATTIAWPAYPTPPAVDMDGGCLVLAGTGSFNSASNRFHGSSYAILSNNGEVVIDPDLKLNSIGTQPALGGTSTFRFEESAAVYVRHQGPGDLIFPEVSGSPGDTVSLVVGRSAYTPQPVPGLGRLWMHPDSMGHIGTAVLASEPHLFAALIPVDLLIGTPLTFQVLRIDAQGRPSISVPSELPVAFGCRLCK